MPVIDADTHVDETEDTWEYIQPGDEAFKPVVGYPSNPDPNRPLTRYWMIDGKRQQRFTRDDERTRTTVEMRELLDVSARLRAMDELGTDIQVIYPTLFLPEGTDKPEVELATRRSYNRWLADRCAQSKGRLRWVCLPPYRSMDKALEELRWAKDHGACGILKKGSQEADRWFSDEYFHPLYEEAEKLDLPICVHTGTGVPDYSPRNEFLFSSFIRFTSPVPSAFEAAILFGLTRKFPKLRFGFIEAGASWVPFLIYHLRRRQERLAGDSTFGRPEYELPEDVMKHHRLYVTCQVDEDLPYITKVAGEDNLLVGSDFTHGDSAQELDFRKRLLERADRGEISHALVKKITEDNPKAFYGL
ncbi:MAG TPA: amidohydrolase family protein [Chloroflexota bacterium]|nr:amidohydrolase family protein [Chloroflexota bacterium]